MLVWCSLCLLPLRSGANPPGCVIFIGSTACKDDLPVAIARCFTHELPVGAPTREEHAVLLQHLLQPVAGNGLPQVRRKFLILHLLI